MQEGFRDRLLILIERAKAGQGTRNLAYKLGLHLKTIQNWEKGTIPSVENLAKLAEILGCSLTELIQYLEGTGEFPNQSEAIISKLHGLPRSEVAQVIKAAAEILAN